MPRKVVKAADLPPPHQMNEDDFDAICRTSGIPKDQRSALRDWLDDAATTFQQVITEARTLPTRKADRLSIKKRGSKTCAKRSTSSGKRRWDPLAGGA